MEPPDARPEAAAAPAAEEGVPVIGQDPEKAPLVEPQPEPAAELDGVRVDVTEQRQRQREPEPQDGALPTEGEQGETITITLKEFITDNAFQVSVAADADVAALKRLIHEEHDGAAEPDGQRLLLNDSPLEDETEKLCDLGIVEGTELRLGGQDAAEGRARREARRADRAVALRESLGERHKQTISDETALCLVDAGCRTQADVWSLGAEKFASLPDEAAEEVLQAKEDDRVASEERKDWALLWFWFAALVAGAVGIWEVVCAVHAAMLEADGAPDDSEGGDGDEPLMTWLMSLSLWFAIPSVELFAVVSDPGGCFRCRCRCNYRRRAREAGKEVDGESPGGRSRREAEAKRLSQWQRRCFR